MAKARKIVRAVADELGLTTPEPAKRRRPAARARRPAAKRVRTKSLRAAGD